MEWMKNTSTIYKDMLIKTAHAPGKFFLAYIYIY